MLKPKPLKAGDTIGIIAPASPTTFEKVQLAKLKIEALGFKVKLGKSCFKSMGYLAGSDELRVEDINNMFTDKEIKGVICLRGGYGSLRLLNKIDFQLLKDNPKIFVGYSDITTLHIAINQICNMVTFHGPMAVNIAEKFFNEYSRDYLIKALTSAKPMGMLTNPAGENIVKLRGGRAKGKIIGGNLSLVTSTLGTPFEIDTKGKILFLEEIGEEPYRVDRMLTQLALAGKLEDAVGFVLGDWEDCEARGTEESPKLIEVIKDILLPFKKPILYNLQAGHCRIKLTIPFGVEAMLNADDKILKIEESATLL